MTNPAATSRDERGVGVWDAPRAQKRTSPAGGGRGESRDTECLGGAMEIYDTFDRRLLVRNLILRRDGERLLLTKAKSPET